MADHSEVLPNPLYAAVTGKADKFDPPWQDGQNHARVTPAEMGGALQLDELPAKPAVPNLTPLEAALLRRMQNRETRALQFNTGGISAGATIPTVCAFGEAVPQGFAWDIKSVQVGPGDWTALPYATGVTTLVVARNPQQRASAAATAIGITAADVIGFSITWPCTFTWGRHVQSATFPEQIQVIVMGLAVGVQITAALQIEGTAAGVREIRSL